MKNYFTHYCSGFVGFSLTDFLSFPLQPRKLDFYFVVYDPKSNPVRGRPCMEFRLKPKGLRGYNTPSFSLPKKEGIGEGTRTETELPI